MTEETKQTDRREFIKTFSRITSLTFAASSLPWIIQAQNAAGNQDNPGQRIRTGIIGIGSRGKLLLIYLLEIPEIEVVAYCDDYPPHFNRAGEMIGSGARGYTDYREMYEKEDLDAVVIATPLYEHARMSIDAMEAGLHVFCEKAMAYSMQECYDMYRTHLETGMILQIGHQRLFNVLALAAIDRIRSGEVGPVTQIKAFWHRNRDWRRPVPEPSLERKINWRLYLEFSRGLMTELASHQLQVANWVLGEVPESVCGFGSINYWKDGREVFDNVNLVYRYPGGTHVIYDSLTSNKHYGLDEQVMGPLGTIEFNSGKIFQENPPPAPGILQLVNQIEKGLFEAIPVGGPSWVPDDPSKDKGSYILNEVLESDGSRIQLETFAASVRENKVIPGLAEHGYNAGITALMGHEAMVRKETIEWPGDLPKAIANY